MYTEADTEQLAHWEERDARETDTRRICMKTLAWKNKEKAIVGIVWSMYTCDGNKQEIGKE